MPLLTDNIDEAQLLFTAVEARATSAELRADLLQRTVDKLKAQVPLSLAQTRGILQDATDREAANAVLTTQQVSQVSPDLPLNSFIASIAMAAALGEATMPDRTIPSVGTTLTSFPTPDGGVRFYQPELGDPTGAGSITFTMVRTPSATGAPPPLNLYLVVESLQTVFDDGFWSGQAAPSAQQIVTETGKILANAAGWSFAFLVAECSTLSNMLTSLGAALTDSPAARALNAATVTLRSLAASLAPALRPVPVVGDLMALTSALSFVAQLAEALRHT